MDLLPVKSLISSASIKYGPVFHHFRKWAKDGSWQRVHHKLISQYKYRLNLSIGLFDGGYSPAKRGGEQVAYKGRKRCKTTNTLWLTDADGLVVGFTMPMAGNHHDVANIRERLEKLVEQLSESEIRVEGFICQCGCWPSCRGFDSYEFRDACEHVGIELNVPRNYRSNKQACSR